MPTTARPSWTYDGRWQVGDQVTLQEQIDGKHAGISVKIFAINPPHPIMDELSDVDFAYYAKFGASIEYAIVFDTARDAQIHREWGGTMTSSSYEQYFIPAA